MTTYRYEVENIEMQANLCDGEMGRLFNRGYYWAVIQQPFGTVVSLHKNKLLADNARKKRTRMEPLVERERQGLAINRDLPKMLGPKARVPSQPMKLFEYLKFLYGSGHAASVLKRIYLQEFSRGQEYLIEFLRVNDSSLKLTELAKIIELCKMEEPRTKFFAK